MEYHLRLCKGRPGRWGASFARRESGGCCGKWRAERRLTAPLSVPSCHPHLPSLRGLSRTPVTRLTTQQAPLCAIARLAADCLARAPAHMIVVGDRTSLLIAQSEANGAISRTIAANHRAKSA